MSQWNKATWKKGRKKITGQYQYAWSADAFHIVLDSKDPITGRARKIDVKGDNPEFNGWKLTEGK